MEDFYNLYAAFALFGLSFLVLLYTLLFKKNRGLLAYFVLLSPLIAGVAHFFMYKNVGEFILNGKVLSLPRYLDWLFSTPVIIGTLAYFGIPNGHPKKVALVSLLVLLDVFMVITGFAGYFFSDVVYVFVSLAGLLILIAIFVILFKVLPFYNTPLSVRWKYKYLLLFSLFLWPIYPVVAILRDIGDVFTPSMIEGLYALLDVFAKGVFIVFIAIGYPFQDDVMSLNSED